MHRSRQDKLVCQLVTPIKTYEAMAMGKRVIVSDVNALKEMVIDQVNGVYFKADDKEAFKEAVISVLNNKAIGESARDWVVDHRDWQVLMRKLIRVYEDLNVEERISTKSADPFILKIFNIVLNGLRTD